VAAAARRDLRLPPLAWSMQGSAGILARARDHEVRIAKASALLTAWTPIVG
jgi:hypothetical protein